MVVNMDQETKAFTRMIELDLRIKRSGGGEQIIADLLRDIQAFKRANPTQTFVQLSAELQNLTSTYRTNNATLLRWTSDQQSAKSKTDNLTGSISKLKTGFSLLLSPLNSLSGLIGGEALGFGAAIKSVEQFNKSLLSTSAQFTKYNIGVGGLEKALTSVTTKIGLTRKETLALYSQYEKGFPFASLDGGAKIFDHMKNAVGGNAEAMAGMLSTLESIIDKFPELEQSITKMSDGDKNILEASSRLSYFSGKLSLSEHKRFEDYIQGSKKISTADDERKKEVQEQIDAMNRLRLTFETLSLQIGQMLMPAMKWISGEMTKWLPTIQAWIGPLGKAALILEGMALSFKAMKMTKGLLDFAGIKTPSLKSTFNMGGNSGGAGGWGSKLVGTGLSSPSFYAQGLKGGAAGFVAGKGVDLGYESLTGRELSQDHGDMAVGGEIAKTGAQIGAGFATGGVPGAIFAGIASSLENIYHIVQSWYGEQNSIRSVKADTEKINSDSVGMADKLVQSLQKKLDAASSPEEKRKISVQLDAAKLNASATGLQKDKAGWNTGYMAAGYRTAANFTSYLNPVDNAQRLFGGDPIADREESERSIGLGSGSSEGEAQMRKANEMRRNADKEDTQQHTDRVGDILKNANIKIDDKQLKDLMITLEQSREGSGVFQAKLEGYGVSKNRSGDIDKLWDKPESKEFEQLIRTAGRGMTGMKPVDEERASNPEQGVAGDAMQPEISKMLADAAKQMISGDMAGASQTQQRAMDKVGSISVENSAYHARDSDVKAAGDYGVDASRLKSDSRFRFDDKIYSNLGQASEKSGAEMTSITDKARSEGRTELNPEEQKAYDHAAAANKVINDLLQNRSKIMDQFSPQMTQIDAEYNQQNKSIQATNELLQAQKEYLSKIVAVVQTTGNVDPTAIVGAGKEALDSLDKYNAGIKSQLELQKTQLQITLEQYDTEIQANKAKIAAAQAKGDNTEVDKLKAENDQYEFAKKQGAAIIEAKTDMINKTGTLAEKEKQIVDILKQQLDPYKAQVEYAGALADKSEALISLYDNMGAGLQASVEMRMQAVEAIGKQIGAEKDNLSMLDKIISEGKESMANTVREEMTKALKPGEKIDESKVQAEASKRLISLDTERVKKQTQIYQLMSKQASITKTMRDGYVSAITAMTAGSGMFNKILITQDKNLGFGLRQMSVLTSKTSGGTSGGKTQAAQFTDHGMDYGDKNAPGYMTYDGHMSQRNPGEVTEANAVAETDARRAGVPGSNNFGNGMTGSGSNNLGAVLGQAADNGTAVQLNPTQPISAVPPATAPTVQPAQPAVAQAPANPQLTTANMPAVPNAQENPTAPTSGQTPELNQLVKIGQTGEQQVTVLNRIADLTNGILNKPSSGGSGSVTNTTINNGGASPITPVARFGGIMAYRHGGMTGKNDLSNLSMMEHGMSGLTKGQPEKGDQYHIKVAGGEAIMNRTQYPHVASGLGMSTQEFEDMVRSKDYSRAHKKKGKDGEFATGGIVGHAKPLKHIKPPLKHKKKPKDIVLAKNTEREASVVQPAVKPIAKAVDKKPDVQPTPPVNKPTVVPPALPAKPVIPLAPTSVQPDKILEYDKQFVAESQARLDDWKEAVDTRYAEYISIKAQAETEQTVDTTKIDQQLAALKEQKIAAVNQKRLRDQVWGPSDAEGKRIAKVSAARSEITQDYEVKQTNDAYASFGKAFDGSHDIPNALEKSAGDAAFNTQLYPELVDNQIADKQQEKAQMIERHTSGKDAAELKEKVEKAAKAYHEAQEYLAMEQRSLDFRLAQQKKDIERHNKLYPPGSVEPTVATQNANNLVTINGFTGTLPPGVAMGNAKSTATPTGEIKINGFTGIVPPGAVKPGSMMAMRLASPYWSSNIPLPMPVGVNDNQLPIDSKGNVIAREGWNYTKDNGQKWPHTNVGELDGARWYNPQESQIIKSERPYDWKKHQFLGESAKPEIADKTKDWGQLDTMSDGSKVWNNQINDESVAAAEAEKNPAWASASNQQKSQMVLDLVNKARAGRDKHGWADAWKPADLADLHGSYTKGILSGSMLAMAKKKGQDTALASASNMIGDLPHFASGGTIPHVGNMQHHVKKALGMSTVGESTLGVFDPGSEVIRNNQTSKPLPVARGDQPHTARSSSPSPTSNSNGSSTATATINISNLTVKIADAGMMDKAMTSKIETELNKVLKQMSGGGKTSLPRSTG